MQTESKKKNILYHYTSVKTLMEILDIKDNEKICLRATHVKYFNDPYEYNHAITLLRSSMIQYEKENHIKNKKSQIFSKKMLTSLSMFSGYPFILSLSENSDNLTMWRTYGADGNGVAIGFDKDMLENYSLDKANEDTRLLKCQYKKEDTIKELTIYLKTVYEKIQLKRSPIKLNVDTIRLILDMCVFCFRFKKFEYHGENEWRLCKNISGQKNVKYFERNGLIIPFIEHFFPKEIIKNVIVGPCVNKKLTRESIIMLLQSRGFKLSKESVIMSKAPYRKI